MRDAHSAHRRVENIDACGTYGAPEGFTQLDSLMPAAFGGNHREGQEWPRL